MHHLTAQPGNALTRHELQEYCSKETDSLFIYYKKVDTPVCHKTRSISKANLPLYYRLCPQATLLQVLQGKKVIEFPTFLVRLSELAGPGITIVDQPRL